MRVPISWLREYCDPPLTTAEIGDRLAMTGTEPDRIEQFGVPSADGFVIGKVLDAEQHPDADRLRVCQVDTGGSAPQTIVCGAPNVAAGQTVAVALPGATMPGGQRLGEAKLRGVVSSGMILAEDEVGVGEDHGGIMVLPDGLAAGVPLLDHLTIFDDVLDLEVEPNRPDCLSVYGVARELHAATGAPLAPDPTGEDAVASGDDNVSDHASVEIADPDVCPRFTARVFDGVKVGPSPLWLKARLAAAGQRSISNVVDITNYVMLLTGQPLHAFDLDEVRGRRIVVRRARDGERMVTLDGVARTFDSSMALVCDAEGPSGIAGIMGGRVSEVSERTTRVLMEAATWVGPNVLKSSARLGLRSEASARFEKQLHPEQALAAQRLAARLMVELCGARMAPGTIDEYPGRAEPRVVALRHARIGALLGTEIPRPEVEAILGRLGFAPEATDAGYEVTVPPFRDADVHREADLIEEVARIHGLERLPATLPARRRAVGRLTPAQRVRRRVEDALRDRGLREVVAYSFTAPSTLARLRLEEDALAVGNPLSEEASVMRPLLLPGLLDAAARNAARGRPGVALFESAHVYRPGEVAEPPPAGPASVPADERHHVAALLTSAAPGTWRRPPLAADFFAVKGLVEALLAALRIEWAVEPVQRPFLHPGRSAQVVSGGGRLGWIGELHPAVVREWALDGAAAFELDLDAIAALAPDGADYREVSTFPLLLQDIAVVVPEAVTAAEVDTVVRRGGGDLLSGTALFDVYHGEQVGEGNRSLALRLEFGAPDRTLTDDDVAELRGRIERELESIGGRLRA